MLREDEYADIRVLGANLARRAEPFVGLRGRHADVHDRDVGGVAAHLEHQILGGARLPDDLEAELMQQPRHAFAEQHGILGDRDPQLLGRLLHVPADRLRLRVAVAQPERRELAQ